MASPAAPSPPPPGLPASQGTAPPLQDTPAPSQGSATAPDTAATGDPPWPYEPDAGVPIAKPTWDCPGGTCACHPVAADEEPRKEHTIVFFDPQGARMPGTRCRVYEQGQLISKEPAKTDGSGELKVQIRASTSTLDVEWAPATLPQHAFMPYRKRYHVRVGDDETRAAERRLSNLGFGWRRSRRENVLDYQRAFAEVETGHLRDIQGEVAARHDSGAMPMFAPQAPEANMPHSNPQARSFAPASFRLAPDGSGQGSSLVERARIIESDEDGSGSPAATGSGAQNPRGSVVAEAGHIWLLVSLENEIRPLKPEDITLRLRPLDVPSMTEKQRETNIRPILPGERFEYAGVTYVSYAFLDVPLGKYAAIVHIDKVMGSLHGYALGSTEILVKMGLLSLGHVAARGNRPILTVADPLLDLDIPLMQRRRKVLATVHKYFPHSTAGKVKRAEVTSPYDQGPYKEMLVSAAGQNNCAPVNVFIMGKASKNRSIYGTNMPKHPGWVPFQQGLAPSVGDSYYLSSETKPGKFEHCGIIVQSSPDFGELWLTADAGQPDRTTEFRHGYKKGTRWRRYYAPPESFEGGFVVPRLFLQDAQGRAAMASLFIYPAPPPKGGHLLAGWVDITHPKVEFKEAYDAEGTEADYRAFKKLALALPARVKKDREDCARLIAEEEARSPAPPEPSTA